MSKYIFRFGLINRKLFLPFLLGLSQVSINIINKYFPEKKKCQIMESFSIAIGQMAIIIIPHLKIFSFEKEKVSIKKYSTSKVICHYFILCMNYSFLVSLFIVLALLKEKAKNNEEEAFKSPHSYTLFSVESLQIIFISLVSICLLKYKYFIHHIIALLTFIALSLSIDFILGNFIFEYDKEILILGIVYIIQLLVDSINMTYQKYMIDKLYYSPYNMIFSLGLLLFFINFSSFTFCLISGDQSNKPENNRINLFSEFYEYFKVVDIFIIISKFILNIIVYFIFNALRILTIYYFTPNHILISYELSKIFELFTTNNDNMKYFTIIPFLFQFLSLMFYLEIFELNFCGLNKNTRRNIENREEKEMALQNEDEDTNSEKGNICEISDGYFIRKNNQNDDYFDINENNDENKKELELNSYN